MNTLETMVDATQKAAQNISRQCDDIRAELAKKACEPSPPTGLPPDCELAEEKQRPPRKGEEFLYLDGGLGIAEFDFSLESPRWIVRRKRAKCEWKAGDWGVDSNDMTDWVQIDKPYFSDAWFTAVRQSSQNYIGCRKLLSSLLPIPARPDEVALLLLAGQHKRLTGKIVDCSVPGTCFVASDQCTCFIATAGVGTKHDLFGYLRWEWQPIPAEKPKVTRVRAWEPGIKTEEGDVLVRVLQCYGDSCPTVYVVNADGYPVGGSQVARINVDGIVLAGYMSTTIGLPLDDRGRIKLIGM
ncbi:MAG: hypothetical protein IMZ62_12950 [Chloroflexi bacterium]|nr:hypothetical protein [Chloroflexota bacterium]MBE3118186.1 hypothetical protein [Candidatus Atribacteria bacterium]